MNRSEASRTRFAPTFVPLLFAALVAAAFAVLAVTQQLRSQPLILDAVTMTERFVPAEGERARIRFRLTKNVSGVRVVVFRRGAGSVQTLADDAQLGDWEFHVFRWGGRQRDGALAPPGAYKVRVELGSLERRIVLPGRVELAPPAGDG